MTRWRQLAFDRGGALFLVFLVVYMWLAPSTIVDGDNAEFATMGALGGRAHPSGYPAYVLYLRAMSWLPGATPAHTTALATSLLGALTVLALHAAIRAWGVRPIFATIACAIYGASPVVLRMHTEAEVFAGNALVVACVLWLAAAEGPVRGIARCALLGGVAGLGLANHMTCALVAPVGILGVVRGIRETPRRPLAVAAAIGALVVGLLPYLYLFVADTEVSFGRVDSWSDWFAFVMREDYGGPVAFVPTGEEVSSAMNLGALVATLGRAWLWLPGALGIAMLGLMCARPRGESRWAWALLATSFAIAGPILVLRFNIAPEGIGLYTCQRFHLLPMLLLGIPVALALDRIAAAIARRQAMPLLERPPVATGLVLAGALALVVVALPRLRAQHSPAVELGVRNMLEALPEYAIVVVTGSEELCIGPEYLRHARGIRRDVDIVCWPLISREWYRRRLIAREIPLVPFDREFTPKQAEAMLSTSRPLYVDDHRLRVVDALPGYPEGTLLRLLLPLTSPPKLREVIEINQRIYARFDLDYPNPGPDDDFAAVAHWRYARTWRLLADTLRARGNLDAANDAAKLADQLAPH